MDDFVTVLTVSYPQQLWIIKSRLEAEGIVCFVKDELTVQTNNLWSNAVGGVKLQVQRDDFNKAIELLKELDYIKEEATNQDDLLTRMDRKTSSLPFLKNISVAKRIVILFVLFIAILISIIYWVIKPTKTELLSKQVWCIDFIYYKGKLIGPNSLNGMRITYSNGNVPCYENAEFRRNGDLTFPGVGTRVLFGSWVLDDGDNLKIKVDTLKTIFENRYNVDVSTNKLVLHSKTTTIYGHVDRTPMPSLF
jgi:hypothetical protein